MLKWLLKFSVSLAFTHTKTSSRTLFGWKPDTETLPCSFQLTDFYILSFSTGKEMDSTEKEPLKGRATVSLPNINQSCFFFFSVIISHGCK